MNRNQDSFRRTVNVEETSSKAMLAIDGAGFDWSYMVDDEALQTWLLWLFQTMSEDTYNEVRESPDALIGLRSWCQMISLEKKTTFHTVLR
ncbi:hypothetical protein Tco_1105795 [Tanacetum coccineum]